MHVLSSKISFKIRQQKEIRRSRRLEGLLISKTGNEITFKDSGEISLIDFLILF